jgi:hypothetical protein
MNSGRAEFSPYTRPPQVGQKWRVLMLPLSAVLAKLRVSPVILTSSRLKNAKDMWPVPEARWQSLQWHWPMPIGCPSTEKVTAPQGSDR